MSELEKNSCNFKNKLPSEKNTIKGQYKRLKKTIKVMLYFCDNFPKAIPQDPSNLVSWQHQISSLAECAMNALLEEIPNSPSKRITPADLLKAEIVKDWDNPDSPLAKRLPKDTPNAILAHFGFNLK
jgi:serine/threonine protein kinase